MRNGREASLLGAIRNLLRLDREAHLIRPDSEEYVVVQRRLDDQRKLVRRLAADRDDENKTD